MTSFHLSPSSSRLSCAVVILAIGLAGCARPEATNSASAAPAAGAPGMPAMEVQSSAGVETFTGTLVETMDSGGYTYMRLQADGKDVWIAASQMPVTKGETFTAPLEMAMADFHSNTLNRDFPMIYFVTQVARAGEPLQSAGSAPTGLPTMPLASHGTTQAAPPMGGAQASGAPVVKATPPPAGGLSIADTWAQRTALAGKTVTVRGTVVKVNNGILGSNWLHLQDGSGAADDGTNDITVTTDAMVQVGAVVTVSGILSVDKDFSAGYVYKAIIENATIK